MSESQIHRQSLDGVKYFLQHTKLPIPREVEFGILSQDPFVIVERMCWEDGAGYSRSAIVKHLPWDQIPLQGYNELDPAIQYETVAYQFLSLIRSDFNYFPRVLAILPGIIMMEDLGTARIDLPDELTAQRCALDALVRMHSASLGKYDLYHSLLNGMGIPEDDDRIVAHSKWDFKLSNGRKYLMAWAHMIGIRDHRWIKELEKAENLLHDPGPFHCFLHNDFISFRQSVACDEKLYLLDFEHARFGHAMVDVLNLFFGKIEYNSRKGIWYRKFYIPAEGVFEFYRRGFEENSGRKYGEELWNHHFSSVAAAMAVAMIETLIKAPELFEEMEPGFIPGRPFTDDLQQLLQTTIKLIGLHPSYSGLLDFFNELVEKLPIISALNAG